MKGKSFGSWCQKLQQPAAFFCICVQGDMEPAGKISPYVKADTVRAADIIKKLMTHYDKERW